MKPTNAELQRANDALKEHNGALLSANKELRRQLEALGVYSSTDLKRYARYAECERRLRERVEGI